MDYDVAQSLCSHIVPKAVLLFTGEALDDGMEFEPEDGEGDDYNNEGGDEEGGGGSLYPVRYCDFMLFMNALDDFSLLKLQFTEI